MKGNAMIRSGISVSGMGAALVAFLISAIPLAHAEVGKDLFQSDQAFVDAIAKSDRKTLSQSLDDNFAWTDSAGKTFSRTEVLQTIPASAGDLAAASIEKHEYGDVGLIMATTGRVHVARFWVKRNGEWRLIVNHEATLSEEARSGAPRPRECENPCKTLPYAPKNDAERGIVASWQALETAVTNHQSEIWAHHIADEFLLINSNNDHPFTKADRMAILDKQKQTGTASAPIPLLSAKMFDFGDAVIMTAEHQRGTDKPVHVSRIWIKRNGKWLMAFSEQTIEQ
jgi:hypothetical protein